MKIALVQINTTVGDLEGNIQKIMTTYQQSADQGAGLVIYPEMAVTGYPPLDLLNRKSFIKQAQKATNRLAQSMRGPTCIFGCVLENPNPKGRSLHNAAVVASGGKIQSIHTKSNLPTYDIFSEDRYFEPAAYRSPAKIANLSVGITVCEDIWPGPDDDSSRYHIDPIADLTKQGMDILVNLSASPYNKDKIQTREKLLRRIADQTGIPVFLANMVGGNDSVLFDGTSLAVFPKTGVIAQAKSFEEDIVFVSLENQPGQIHSNTTSFEDEIYRALCMGLRDYTYKCGFKQAVLGLSGGIDSAVCAVLAAEALGPENLWALSMPSCYSSPGSYLDADRLAKNLGIRFVSVPIHPSLNAYHESLNPHLGEIHGSLTEENIQARIRGNLLMAFSNHNHLLTLATGNKSELAVGYCTLYGDMVGGIAPIGDLTKTQVYRLAAHINRKREIIPKEIIKKPPSAELHPGQVDQDSLPPYDVLDTIVELYVEEGLDQLQIAELGYNLDTVQNIIRMVEHSEYKRRQAAIVLRVNRHAFGLGRQIPIARAISFEPQP